MEVTKHAAMVPMSEELVIEAAAYRESLERWMLAMPEQRAEWIRESEARRREERRAAGEPTALTLDGLLAKLGFSRDYAEHLVQPYCYCGDGPDGWDRCAHARDLGLG